MKSNNSKRISEDDFLKNKARRKSSSDKTIKKNEKKKSSGNAVLKGFLIALGVLVGIIVLFAIVALMYFAAVNSTPPDNSDSSKDKILNSEGEEVNRLISDDGSKKYYTFLATATDAGGALTDVIMVARLRYDEKAPSVDILQIPRDTYVKIAGDKLYFTKDGALSAENFSSKTANTSIKINEIYYKGKKLAKDKINELLDAVEGKSDAEIEKILEKKEYVFIDADAKKVKDYAKASNNTQKEQLKNEIHRDFGITYLKNLIYYDFGIPIDYHAQVNIKGFRGVVDAIDGVDLYVPQDMDYEDEFQDLYIHLKKGQQHLNGKKAEQFVRFRGYPGGDVARLDAQKLFMDAFLDKLLSFSTVTKIDDIVTEIQENLYTDVSFNNMLRFANKVLTMDLGKDIHIHTLPGVGEYIGEASYFITDRDKTIELVNHNFNVFDASLLDADFRIIDSESIYRPASVDASEGASDSDEVSDEKDKEDNKDEKDDDKDDKEDNDENNKDDTEEVTDKKDADEEDSKGNDDVDDSKNSSDEDKNTSEKEDSDNKSDINEDSEEDNEKPASEPVQEDKKQPETDVNASSAQLDDNYQLLLDMAA